MLRPDSIFKLFLDEIVCASALTGGGMRHHVVAAGIESPSSIPRGRVPLEGTQAWQSVCTWDTRALDRVRAAFREFRELLDEEG